MLLPFMKLIIWWPSSMMKHKSNMQLYIFWSTSFCDAKLILYIFCNTFLQCWRKRVFIFSLKVFRQRIQLMHLKFHIVKNRKFDRKNLAHGPLVQIFEIEPLSCHAILNYIETIWDVFVCKMLKMRVFENKSLLKLCYASCSTWSTIMTDEICLLILFYKLFLCLQKPIVLWNVLSNVFWVLNNWLETIRRRKCYGIEILASISKMKVFSFMLRMK